MNMSIVGRHMELTDGIKHYIENAFESLQKYHLDIISISAILSSDERKGKQRTSANFTINLAHKGTVVIQHKDKDLYAAVDLAVDRAQKVLRRHHDKVTDHKHAGMEENTAAALASEEPQLDGFEDEIVPMDLELHKPMEIDEALSRLKEGTQQFMIFNDIDGKTRVIHKRSDAKFGLY